MNIIIYLIAAFFAWMLGYLVAGNFAPEAVAVANVTGFWSWMNTTTVMIGLIIILLPIIVLALLRAAAEAGRNIK
jgi:hypothetical protein